MGIRRCLVSNDILERWLHCDSEMWNTGSNIPGDAKVVSVRPHSQETFEVRLSSRIWDGDEGYFGVVFHVFPVDYMEPARTY
jgi:hypothetical protein